MSCVSNVIIYKIDQLCEMKDISTDTTIYIAMMQSATGYNC